MIRQQPVEERLAEALAENERLRRLVREAVAHFKHTHSCDGAHYADGLPVCPCETCGREGQFASYLEWSVDHA